MTEIYTVEGIDTLIWCIWNNKTYSCGLACKYNFVFIKFMLLVLIKIYINKNFTVHNCVSIKN